MSRFYPKILVADDDQVVLDVIKMYLNDIGEVVTVTNGKQALAYLMDNDVDVILLDVEMPAMDGFTTLKHIRNMKEGINVPVIMVTGKTDTATVLLSVKKGVDGYLAKPINKEHLVSKVKSVIEARKQTIGKLHVLAIDDDMTQLKLFHSYLQDEYHVIMINSAKLAVEYLMKHVPDIILLDYQMPLYSGAHIMGMLRKNPVTENIPVLIISGSIDKEAMQECLAYRPAGCLVKPIDRDNLKTTIKNILAKHRKR